MQNKHDKQAQALRRIRLAIRQNTVSLPAGTGFGILKKINGRWYITSTQAKLK
jgi:hypothetical protein